MNPDGTLIDFRESPRLIQASDTIHKYFSDLAHATIMLSVQAHANDIKEAEKIMVDIPLSVQTLIQRTKWG